MFTSKNAAKSHADETMQNVVCNASFQHADVSPSPFKVVGYNLKKKKTEENEDGWKVFFNIVDGGEGTIPEDNRIRVTENQLTPVKESSNLLVSPTVRKPGMKQCKNDTCRSDLNCIFNILLVQSSFVLPLPLGLVPESPAILRSVSLRSPSLHARISYRELGCNSTPPCRRAG